MGQSSQSGSASAGSVPEEFLRELHGFLSLEAPFLIRGLPQVATETGWNREQFMNSLCAHKAGMPSDAWKKGGCDIFIFTAEVFGD